MRNSAICRIAARTIGVFAVLGILHAGGAATIVTAQPRPPIKGSMNLDLSTSKEVRSGKRAQEQALVFAAGLKAAVETAATSGSLTAVAAPSDLAVAHLNYAYLFCSIAEGTCEYMLQALLAADVINAKVSGEVRCPVLERFWRSYLDGGLEDRHRYQTKTGFLTQTVNFNQKVRPRYVNCVATVKSLMPELQNADAVRKYFGSGDASARGAVNRTTAYLETLKAQVPDILEALGIGKAPAR